jgi:hypothetical protein
MMTRGDVVDLIELALADSGNATFAEATVQDWLEEAIRAYSVHFPVITTATLNCSADTHAYTLAEGTMGIVKVEYPKGEDPPEYLNPRSRKSAGFWDREGYYDAELDGQGDGALYISEDPDEDDQIEVTYLAMHTTSFSGDSSYVTVPEEHVPILVAYCVWKGTRELLLTEQQNPDTTIHLIYDMTRQAQAAWDAYNDLIKQALASAGRSAVTTGWAMDDYDPIY